MTVSSLEELRTVRRKLARAMTCLDEDVREHSFAFESIFSDDPPDRAGPACMPSVVVRVQLRGHLRDALYRWEVRVDHHLPLGATGEEAQSYATWISKAAKKALWAEALTRDLAWEAEQLRGDP